MYCLTCLPLDLAHCEKLGTSNFYWSFPGEQTQNARHKQEKLQEREKNLHEQKREQEARLERAKEANPETEERTALQERYNSASSRFQELKQQKKRLSDLGNPSDYIDTIRAAVHGINIYTGTS